MSKANYSHETVEEVLCIEDLGPHDMFKTVTNDAENVLEEIKKELGDDMPPVIIYQDSEGFWDGMEYNDQRVEFYSLNTSDREHAIVKALQRWSDINSQSK